MKDPFIVLNIDEEADDEAVRTAYLQQVRACPPERDPERFQAIRQAYETIADRRARMGVRLFFVPEPDLPALLAPLLGGGSPIPPSEQNIRALLSASLRSVQWPLEPEKR